MARNWKAYGLYFCSLLILPLFASAGTARATLKPPAQEVGAAPAAEGQTVTTVVSVLGAKDATAPAPIDKGDVSVFSGKTRLSVTGWTPVQNNSQEKAELAILIDNDVASSILGQQLEDLTKFINTLPANISVGVFYGQFGSAVAVAPFSADHQAVSQKLRLSEGRGGDSPSIYFSLEDLVSHWLPDGAPRHEVLMISSGVDPYHPGVQDPYIDSTLDKVQRAGVVVYAIYDGSSRFGASFLGDTSQGKLIQITEETGGQSFMEGTITPISIAGYLNQLAMQLNNQYLLTFTIEPSKNEKGELRSIEVHLEQRDVKVSYPRRVWVPGEKSRLTVRLHVTI